MQKTERRASENTAHEGRGAGEGEQGGGFLGRAARVLGGVALVLRSVRALRGQPPSSAAVTPAAAEDVRASRPSLGGAEAGQAATESVAATDPVATETKPASPVTGPLGLAKELYARFQEDDGFVRAAALAFFGVLSLIPVLLFALAVLGFLIRDPQEAAEYVRQFVQGFLPGKQAAAAANAVIQQTNVVDGARSLINGRWTAAVIGVVSLLWTATTLLVNAAAPMNAAWDVKEDRPFVRLRLLCLALFLGTGLFFFGALVVSSFPEYARRATPAYFGLQGLFLAALELASWVVGIALNAALFTVLYRFLPNAKVSWKAAAFGGVVTGVLWELFKQLFTWYAGNFGDFNKTYGALGGIVLLITWIYYSCVILLLGAEMASMWHEHRETGAVTRRGAGQPGV